MIGKRGVRFEKNHYLFPTSVGMHPLREGMPEEEENRMKLTTSTRRRTMRRPDL